MLNSEIIATCTLTGISPYCQSQHYDVPFLEGESHENHSKRCFRHSLFVQNGTVHIKAMAMHFCIAEAAGQIKKKAMATWGKAIGAGIAIFDNIDLGIDPESVEGIPIYANLDGRRGSGKRGLRWLPQMPEWGATFDIRILDPEITRPVFEAVMERAGMYVGIGQHAPRNKGTNGRFRAAVDWKADRRPGPSREPE